MSTSTSTTVGIVGAGQLGRMMALAGHALGVRSILLGRDRGSPGGQVAELIDAPLDDRDALEQLARRVDVLTLEIENVPVEPLAELAARVPVYPPPDAVAAAQDRLAEKELFRSLGIPTAPFVPVDTAGDLVRVADDLGWPVVLKARRLGYDGRGQRVARSAAELAAAWRSLGEVPAIAEAWIEFERELSLLMARGADGAQVYYPLAENVHRDGMLHSTVAPYEDANLQGQAERWLSSIARHFDYRGVLAIEFFHAGGALMANEMAPRVHNSGHWTIEGTETSQFENHLRAVLGWPLGETTPRGHAAMVNLVGHLVPPERVLRLPGVHYHSYGKQARPGRKLGHCTIIDTDRARLTRRLQALEEAIAAEGP